MSALRRLLEKHGYMVLEAGTRDAARVLAPNTAFINKPFSGDNLAAKVREVLDGS